MLINAALLHSSYEGTKDTKFERGASTRQLFMLWSHNVGEARYERCVICLDITQSEYLSFLPSYMQLA